MTITICGSITFWKEMEEVQALLQAHGHQVLIPETSTKGKAYWCDMKENDPARFAKEKGEVMIAHLKKVEAADAILVLNYEKHGKAGYIGPNTFIEMGHAFAKDIPIYLYDVYQPEGPFAEEVSGMQCRQLQKSFDTFV